MSETVKYVGLDVHKITIAVAVAEGGKRVGVREHGEVANTPPTPTKLLDKLGGPRIVHHTCYEAGPCGYGIQRQVTAAGHSCVVVAPSLIPSRPGDRIKADRGDAMKLARLNRAGASLPPVSQAQPCRQTDHGRHDGHRPPACWHCVGDRAQSQPSYGVVIAIEEKKAITSAQPYLDLDKIRGTATVGEPSFPLTAGPWSDAGS
jgi:hypothetical protein